MQTTFYFWRHSYWLAGLTILVCLAKAGVAADFTVGSATARSGQKATGYLDIPAGVDAGIRVPVIVINGVNPGPKLALIAGAHGTEYASSVALAQLAARVEPAELSGTLIILPLLNVESYLQKVVHVNPVDHKGVGGYPGKADGTQSERIVNAVYTQVVERCDHLIDYHGGDLDENLHPYSYWTNTGKPELDKTSRDMVFAFGLKMIIIKQARGRGLDNSALALGKASITVEAGRAGTTEAADTGVLIEGTMNVMRYLKMLSGPVTSSLQHPLWISKLTIVKSEQEGIFYPSVVPEAYIHQGMSVGYITDYFGNKTADILAPGTGVITLVCSVPTMKKGDNVVYIGEIGEDPAEAALTEAKFFGELRSVPGTSSRVTLRKFVVLLFFSAAVFGQTKSTTPPVTPGAIAAAAQTVPGGASGQGSSPAGSAWSTRSIQLRYLEPGQLREIFSSRPYVMEVNRELRLLTVTGPSTFLDEVEQTGKRFDVAPPTPVNLDITVYLIATPAQAPTGAELPPELQPFAKAFGSSAAGQAPRLADSETLRVREGQTGNVSFGDSSANGMRLARIDLGSALVTQATKGDVISLNGLRCWISKASGQAGSEADVTANIDVASNQPVLAAKAGIDKPVAVVVRANISK